MPQVGDVLIKAGSQLEAGVLASTSLVPVEAGASLRNFTVYSYGPLKINVAENRTFQIRFHAAIALLLLLHRVFLWYRIVRESTGA